VYLIYLITSAKKF